MNLLPFFFFFTKHKLVKHILEGESQRWQGGTQPDGQGHGKAGRAGLPSSLWQAGSYSLSVCQQGSLVAFPPTSRPLLPSCLSESLPSWAPQTVMETEGRGPPGQTPGTAGPAIVCWATTLTTVCQNQRHKQGQRSQPMAWLAFDKGQGY